VEGVAPMKSRVLGWFGVATTMLLIVDLLCYAMMRWNIHQMAESYPHGRHDIVIVQIIRISDPFGNPWWVLPSCLALAAITCIVLSSRWRSHDRESAKQ
jgi:hypothetical protein